MQLIYNKLCMMCLFFFLPQDFLCATFLKNIYKSIFNERGATQIENTITRRTHKYMWFDFKPRHIHRQHLGKRFTKKHRYYGGGTNTFS